MGTLNVTSTSNGIMEQLRSALSDQFSAIAPFEIVLGLVLGLLVGLLIAFVYKRCFRGVLYSPSFAMTLAMLTLITTPVVMCISSNVALSMGMVGALSIVRFRTAVKDPMDTAYMFWALTMGILLGAKLYAIALVVAAAIAAIIFLLTFVHFTTPNSYLLVVHYDEEAEYDVDQMMRRSVKNRRLRSKTMTRSGAEMTWEVRLDNKQDLVAMMMHCCVAFKALKRPSPAVKKWAICCSMRQRSPKNCINLRHKRAVFKISIARMKTVIWPTNFSRMEIIWHMD